jgi:hypothetical protein
MKVAISIAVAVVMPFGLFVLAGVILSRMLAKLSQERADRIQRPSALRQGQPHWLSFAFTSLQLARADELAQGRHVSGPRVLCRPFNNRPT